jgi:hypothetical protein
VRSTARSEGDVIVVRLASCRPTPRGYVRTTYDASEIDGIAGIAVCCAALKRCHHLPIKELGGRSEVGLRLLPAVNRQEVAINWAEQYEFGAIAQLGERVTGSHEVVGSSPTSSTSRPLP